MSDATPPAPAPAPPDDAGSPDRTRVALVTGAGGDIGRAVAVRLAATGALLVLGDLPKASDQLDATAAACRSAGAAEVVRLGLDVTDAAAVNAAVDRIAGSVGPPVAVVASAGQQGAFAPMTCYPVEVFRSVLDVNVTGAFTVLRACAEALVDAGRPGAFVALSSLAGVAGAPNMVAYAASKAAVLGLVRSAAKDLAADRIRVNAVSPAFIGPGAMWDRQVRLQAEVGSQYYADSEAQVAEQMLAQVPLRRYGTLEEVAAVVGFLLSDDASYLTGINVEVAGGAR